jgi:hypothetical protein
MSAPNQTTPETPVDHDNRRDQEALRFLRGGQPKTTRCHWCQEETAQRVPVEGALVCQACAEGAQAAQKTTPDFGSGWEPGMPILFAHLAHALREAAGVRSDTDAFLMAQAAAEIERLREFAAWVDTWVSNPIGAYSVAALDGLFAMARARLAEMENARD